MAMPDGTPIAMVFACSFEMFQAGLETFRHEQKKLGQPINRLAPFFLRVSGGGGGNNLIRTSVPEEAHTMIDYVILVAHDGCDGANQSMLGQNAQMLSELLPLADVRAYWAEVVAIDRVRPQVPKLGQNWHLN